MPQESRAMSDLSELIAAFRSHVIDKASRPQFRHHRWYVTYHL
jgi:hypothetical protein